MIFEWYSGSDKSGEIPMQVAGFEARRTVPPPDETVTFYRGILGLETDPNWRAAWLTRLAIAQISGDNEAAALAAFEEALRLFDPLAGSFKDVGREYCDAMYGLTRYHPCSQDGDSEPIARWGFALLCNYQRGDLLSWQLTSGLSSLALALITIGRHSNSALLLEMGLAAATAAHHRDPDEPIELENIVVANAFLGNVSQCERALAAYLTVATDESDRKRVCAIVRDRMPRASIPSNVVC